MMVNKYKPKERIKSAAFCMSICKKMVKASYRSSKEFYNDDYHRTGTASELSLSTIVSDYNQEGKRLRETTPILITGILLTTPFNPDTGIFNGDVFPDALKPQPKRVIDIKYEEAMRGERPFWERLEDTSSEGDREASFDNSEDIEGLNDELLGFIFSCEDEEAFENNGGSIGLDSSVTGTTPEDTGQQSDTTSKVKNPNQFINDWLNDPGSKKYSMPDLREKQEETLGRTRKRSTLLTPENRKAALLDYVNYVNTTMATAPELGIPKDWTVELDPDDICNLSVDVVYVPLQKTKAMQGMPEGDEGNSDYLETEFGDGKKNIGHVDVKVEWREYQYNITAPNHEDAFKKLMAVIMVNRLYQHPMHVYTDGEEKLVEKLRKYIGVWNPQVFLDWSHLAHKCYELLSSIILSRRVVDPRGKHERYEKGDNKGQVKKWVMTSLSRLYARELIHILWYGNVEEAISYLENIDPKHIKGWPQLKRLVGYLKRKKEWIPCYGIRRKGGLKNASSSVESENEAMVSNRQKSGGDHWGKEGSSNNAALNEVFLNHEEENWFKHRYLSFRMFNPADYR